MIVAQTDTDLQQFTNFFESTWKRCKKPCNCLEMLAQRSSEFSCKFLRNQNTQDWLKMLVVYPGLTLHSILQHYNTSSCFFAYTVVTLCHKNIGSKSHLCLHHNTAQSFSLSASKYLSYYNVITASFHKKSNFTL